MGGGEGGKANPDAVSVAISVAEAAAPGATVEFCGPATATSRSATSSSATFGEGGAGGGGCLHADATADAGSTAAAFATSSTPATSACRLADSPSVCRCACDVQNARTHRGVQHTSCVDKARCMKGEGRQSIIYEKTGGRARSSLNNVPCAPS